MKTQATKFEKIVALLAAINCIITPMGMSIVQIRSGETWISLLPLPFLYLIEISAAGIFGWIAVFREAKLGGKWHWILWIVSGILTTFVILGRLSIGPLLIPGTMIFFILAILQLRRRNNPIYPSIAILLATMLVQSGLMLILVNIW